MFRTCLQFNIGKEGVWSVEFKKGAVAVRNQAAEKPDVTISASPEDFVGLATGTLLPQAAFMQGKIKIKGNLAVALKLNALREGLSAKSKL